MDVREKATNDKRLIDANKAMEIVRNQGIAHPNAYHLTNYAMLILREAPTVDAVPVVRCWECKYHKDKDTSVKEFEHCSLTGYTVEYDDFCSYGEQKGR